MPNRILRDGILTSERIDKLQSWASECFYRRLHSVVDDFGRYYANASLLRAACYPLKLDKVSNADIGKWLADCAGAALVSTYEIDGKAFLQLLDFRQQVRAKDSKFPPMPSDVQQALSTCIADAQHPPANAHLDGDGDGDGVVVEDGKDTVGQERPTPPPNGKAFKAEAQEILHFLNAKAGRGFPPLDVNLDLIAARLKEGATPAQCRQVIAKKAREWGGDEKMAEYLRPKTLFNRTNFAQYVGELVVTQ